MLVLTCEISFETTYTTLILEQMKTLLESCNFFFSVKENVRVKTFVARANPEKGGMLPLDSMHKIQLVNPNIVFKDFDTAHSVKTEMPEQYFDFLKELIV